jgi:hypothetical protein
VLEQLDEVPIELLGCLEVGEMADPLHEDHVRTT